MNPSAPSWVEASEAALTGNARALKASLRSGALLGVVVKADAYGHGMAICARAFLQGGADWLVVNSAAEAQALRAASIDAPIYVCGPLFEEDAPAVVATGARVVLYDAALARAFDAAARAAGRVVPVHLKIETGTHRQGLSTPDALALGDVVASSTGLSLEGLTTHYADIEDTTNHEFALRQLATLVDAERAFAARGVAVPMVHSANSAATLLWPETHGALVRTGIAAYGLWPSRETTATLLQRAAQAPRLQPVMSWRARIAQVKDVPAGGYVGYGRTFRATHATRIAVLPVGYHEGYDRRLSNVAHVLVRGQRAAVRGRVCMNMMMVDVTDVPDARNGDVATLLGQDGDERVSAEQLAAWMGTIHYEAVSRIHPSAPRVLA